MRFEFYIFSGNQQIYTAGDPAHIYMETKNKYQKKLQMEMPPNPEAWFPLDEDSGAGQAKGTKAWEGPKVAEKGHKRWAGLPEPVDVTSC